MGMPVIKMPAPNPPPQKKFQDTDELLDYLETEAEVAELEMRLRVDQERIRQEKSMASPETILSRGRPKMPKKVWWRSKSGKIVVVEGPFPAGLFRTDTRKTPEAAAKVPMGDMYTHSEPTNQTLRWAKVSAEDIIEIFDGENEYGEICP